MSPRRLRIASPQGELTASFVPELGMICPSLRLGDRELLAERGGLEAYGATGKTMGIPLLYPWANRLALPHYSAAGREANLPEDPSLITRDPNDLPLHGVQPRRMQWTAAMSGNRLGLDARLRWSEPPLTSVFPYRHEVRLEAELSQGSLAITTTIMAMAGDPVPLSFGFHPYLRLPGQRSECQISLPAAQRLALDGRGIPTGERTPLETREFALADSAWDDGLALNESSSRFSVSGPRGTRTVELLEGFQFGQVFAPAQSEFICFEPMTAPANALISGDALRVLKPGEEYRTRFRIVVGGLA